MDIKELTPNPRNPRKITDERLGMLKKSLDTFGPLYGVIFNRTTGRLAGGHQTIKTLPEGSKVVITKTYDVPTKSGTISLGHVIMGDESIPYREVLWDENTEHAANIAANKHGGEWDFPLLSSLLLELDAANIDISITGFSAKDLEDMVNTFSERPDQYTGKITSPIYEPSGEKPSLIQMVDTFKRDLLIKNISTNTTISEEDKKFLLLAAERHTVFNYENIANYYAQSSKEVQEFMEQSALIIIDCNRAIEDGFVTLSNNLAESYKETSDDE